jgi:hypothetical protein
VCTCLVYLAHTHPPTHPPSALIATQATTGVKMFSPLLMTGWSPTAFNHDSMHAIGNVICQLIEAVVGLRVVKSSLAREWMDFEQKVNNRFLNVDLEAVDFEEELTSKLGGPKIDGLVMG